MIAATAHCYGIAQGHNDEVNCASFSPDYEILLTGSDDGTICIFNAVTHQFVKKLCGHEGAVTCVAVSPDSKLLASGSYDRTINLWQTRTASLTRTLRGHTKGLSDVKFALSCKALCSASWDKTAMLWSVETGDLLVIFSGHAASVQAVAFSLGDHYLATSSWDSTVRLWELASVKKESVVAILEGHTGNIAALSFSRHLLLASGGTDRKIIIWNIRNKSQICVFRGHRGCIRCVCFTDNGFFLASISEDGEIRIWSTVKNESISSLEISSMDGLLTCGFHECGSLLVASATSYATCKLQNKLDEAIDSENEEHTLLKNITILTCEKV